MRADAGVDLLGVNARGQGQSCEGHQGVFHRRPSEISFCLRHASEISS
jgi:hypothetical protein